MKISFQYHISGLLKGISLTLIIFFIGCAAQLQTSNNNIVDIISSDTFYFVPMSTDALNVVLKIENYLVNKGYI